MFPAGERRRPVIRPIAIPSEADAELSTRHLKARCYHAGPKPAPLRQSAGVGIIGNETTSDLGQDRFAPCCAGAVARAIRPSNRSAATRGPGRRRSAGLTEVDAVIVQAKAETARSGNQP